MRASYDLLAIGDPCADLVLRAERLPGWDDKTRGESLGLFGGGTEANAACVAARLGWRVALFGRVGDDVYADFIVQDLHRHGVHTDHLQREVRAASSLAIVAVSPQGERAVLWLPPAAAPAQDTGRRRTIALADSRWAYTMPYALDALATLAADAAPSGTRIAVDLEAEGARSQPAEAWLQHCDIAFFNRNGFEAAAGAAPDAQRLQALCRTGRARTVVVTLGGDGALAFDRDDGFARCEAAAATPVDTTGAGDGFNASFLVARDRGAGLPAALAQASGVAARIVGRLGARTALHELQPGHAEAAGER
ncbi:carbohydrate kinase family protein [Aquincola sp. S2]|uniref:Carbohydrate kinase family protein n=1 Tax=Pseudaquabacterium terrae TaxID=2732868 RepID=A0ABX2EM99_9BURK|nr:carbohydrate kinase family protein [Aquabacterium terrae]NRF69777.1 carbohydrate kinase family protein [Aquabacterium terrae]